MSATQRPLTIGVIGAGRVGAVLGAAMVRAGHHVVAVATTAPERAARLLPRAAVLPVDEVARRATDLLLLAVPDDVLSAVVAGLTGTSAGQTLAHTSGAHGLAVFGPRAGLALHPAMTFTGEPGDLERLSGIRWGVTAADRTLAAQLVADLGGVPEWIADSARPLYHAALAHGANHLVTLVNEAADLLRTAGVADPSAVLSPLLHAALDNALARGDAALTGPVSRGDAGTVRGHLAVLPADSAPAYVALARRTVDRAVAVGRLSPDAATPLVDVLAALPTDAPAAALVDVLAAPVGVGRD